MFFLQLCWNVDGLRSVPEALHSQTEVKGIVRNICPFTDSNSHLQSLIPRTIKIRTLCDLKELIQQKIHELQVAKCPLISYYFLNIEIIFQRSTNVHVIQQTFLSSFFICKQTLHEILISAQVCFRHLGWNYLRWMTFSLEKHSCFLDGSRKYFFRGDE